jgi:hypothetical protein
MLINSEKVAASQEGLSSMELTRQTGGSVYM